MLWLDVVVILHIVALYSLGFFYRTQSLDIRKHFNIILPSIEALYKMINMRIKVWEDTVEKEIVFNSQGISISPESLVLLKEKQLLE